MDFRKSKKFRTLVDKIKRGGIIFAPRRYGKTLAAIEVLKENNDFVLSSHSSQEALNLRRQYPEIAKQIYGPDIYNDPIKNKKIIMDEFVYHRNFNNHGWWTAISSLRINQHVSVLGWYRERKEKNTNYTWTETAKEWRLDGELHRIDGPAYIRMDGKVFYFLKGKEVKKSDFYKAWKCPLEELPLYVGTDLYPIVQYRFNGGELR